VAYCGPSGTRAERPEPRDQASGLVHESKDGGFFGPVVGGAGRGGLEGLLPHCEVVLCSVEDEDNFYGDNQYPKIVPTAPYAHFLSASWYF
jgi:hypothetical protein